MTDGQSSGRAWLLAGLLGAVLLVHVPAFVCLPPHYDVVQWDLNVRTVLGGQVMYRDILENNLPGMLVFQVPVRALFGWRSETIRLCDLVFVGASIFLLARMAPGGSATARLGTALVLTCFYLSTNEWCHAQRDGWMLLPALLAFLLRQDACDARARAQSAGRRLGLAILEGLVWGVAVWIKPHVVLPAAACWMMSLVVRRREGLLTWKRTLLEAGGLLLGGLLAGAVGLAWLWRSGAWADFWEILLVWNREYLAHDMFDGFGWLAILALALRFFPWCLVYLAAVPLALVRLRATPPRLDSRTSLLAAFFLGWVGQVMFFQHGFDYTHVPPLLLGLALLCHEAARARATGERSLLPLFLAVCVLVSMLPLTLNRVPLLPDCFREGSTAAMRDRLRLIPRVDWQALDRVGKFLKARGVGNGELTCMNMGGASLLLDLDVRPATRYIALQNNVAVFVKQQGRIWADLARSDQRYLLVDVQGTLWKGAEVPPPDERVLLEEGRYRLYACDGAEMSEWARRNLNLSGKAR